MVRQLNKIMRNKNPWKPLPLPYFSKQMVLVSFALFAFTACNDNDVVLGTLGALIGLLVVIIILLVIFIFWQRKTGESSY